MNDSMISLSKRRAWLNGLVGYIIVPSSFYDTNGDGIGDLKGIARKLDYLADLGVNLLWILPLNVTPFKDLGYDVADHDDIDPRFGTKEDYQELLRGAHARGMLVLMDLVLNHTSDKHRWFQSALSDPASSYQDYYIFAKPLKKDGKVFPINNWQGFFSTSAWTYVPGIDRSYLHIFAKEMPDVNWAHEPLRQEYVRIMNEWLCFGVDGFRLDAVAHLSKDMTFKDGRGPKDENGLILDPRVFSNRPETIEHLRYLKDHVNDPHCLLLGEAGGSLSPRKSLCYTDQKKGVIDMVFNFDTCWCNGAFASIDKKDDEIKTDLITLKKNFARWWKMTHAHVVGLPVYWGDHDHPRVISQYGDVHDRRRSGKMLITTLLFLYGTPFLLYGDEIGMSNVDYKKIKDFQDVSDVNFHAAYKDRYDEKTILRYLQRTSRMNGRTPMQWNTAKEAGFTSGRSYYKVNGNYKEVNVEKEEKDPDSLLHYVQRAIRLRKGPLRRFLLDDFHIHARNDPSVFCYYHLRKGRRLILASNFTKETVPFTLPWKPKKIILTNTKMTWRGRKITLPPFGVILYLA